MQLDVARNMRGSGGSRKSSPGAGFGIIRLDGRSLLKHAGM